MLLEAKLLPMGLFARDASPVTHAGAHRPSNELVRDHDDRQAGHLLKLLCSGDLHTAFATK
jgi:hypothetical protein